MEWEITEREPRVIWQGKYQGRVGVVAVVVVVVVGMGEVVVAATATLAR